MKTQEKVEGYNVVITTTNRVLTPYQMTQAVTQAWELDCPKAVAFATVEGRTLLVKDLGHQRCGCCYKVLVEDVTPPAKEEQH